MGKNTQLLVSLLMLSLVSSLVTSESPSSIQDKCANEVTKVTVCLDYAAGKVPKPSESCCTAATTMRNANPVCMCYIIQQVHEGSPTLKDMGLQVGKLLQLPTDCKIANASVSDCPRLLNLPASSPDYSFFTATNSSKASSKSPPTSESQTADGSTLRRHVVDSVLVAVGVTFFLLSMPVMGLYNL